MAVKPIELMTYGSAKETKSAFNLRFKTNILIKDVNADDYIALTIPDCFEKYGFYDDVYYKKIPQFNECI